MIEMISIILLLLGIAILIWFMKRKNSDREEDYQYNQFKGTPP